MVAVVGGNARSVTFDFAGVQNLNVRFQVEADNAIGTGPKSAVSANIVPR
jgi:hypothetical protein